MATIRVDHNEAQEVPLPSQVRATWLSPSGTLPVFDYFTGMTGSVSAPLCPVSSQVGKKPPGDFSGSEAAGVDARKAGQLHVHQAAVVPCKLERKAHRGENGLNF